MIFGAGVMMIAGWKLFMGTIEAFGFNYVNHEYENPALQTKFVKRDFDSTGKEWHDIPQEVHKVKSDHQVFIPVVSIY